MVVGRFGGRKWEVEGLGQDKDGLGVWASFVLQSHAWHGSWRGKRLDMLRSDPTSSFMPMHAWHGIWHSPFLHAFPHPYHPLPHPMPFPLCCPSPTPTPTPFTYHPPPPPHHLPHYLSFTPALPLPQTYFLPCHHLPALPHTLLCFATTAFPCFLCLTLVGWHGGFGVG